VAEERSSARIASRIIAVWDVTTYVGIDAHKKEPTERRAPCGSSRARRLSLSAVFVNFVGYVSS